MNKKQTQVAGIAIVTWLLSILLGAILYATWDTFTGIAHYLLIGALALTGLAGATLAVKLLTIMGHHSIDLLEHLINVAFGVIERGQAHQTAKLQARMLHAGSGHYLVADEYGRPQLMQTQQKFLSSSAQDEEKEEDVSGIAIPQAPTFSAMSHLITNDQMPLCYTMQNGVSAPAYGTVDDLLSMAITGKPGRGKTTALMYYVCTLLKTGAEVWVWDPHGAMAELATLNGQTLPGVPRTAQVIYLDRREDIVNSIPSLHDELDSRDALYRPRHEVKHPLLLLADELPVLADFDQDTIAEYKATNKQREKDGQLPLDVPTAHRLIKRFVLEARKWKCFFIGSGQTFDADTLPTKVTENLNSRVVFFSSDRRARMSGLETDAIKALLPTIRHAGPGVMIFDCSRWEQSVIGAIPYITVEDMIAFLGVGTSRDEPEIRTEPHLTIVPEMTNRASYSEQTTSLGLSRKSGVTRLVDASPASPEMVPIVPALGPDDKRFTPDQSRVFASQYRQALRGYGTQDIKQILREIGVGNRYHKHASFIAEQIRSEQQKAGM